jgi:hypothetical protein
MNQAAIMIISIKIQIKPIKVIVLATAILIMKRLRYFMELRRQPKQF